MKKIGLEAYIAGLVGSTPFYVSSSIITI